jgi:UDP-N-acetylmuramoyl-L-alanyl-D-glutamate--2,6-diaminopimelate ligase
MATKKLSELLRHVPDIINVPKGQRDPEITAGITEDSRTISPGGLFIARHGQSVDGHRFIQAAVEQGAAAIVGELPPAEVKCSVPYIQVADASLAMAHLAAALHDFPSRKLVVIGVTGTDGKTTTSNLLYNILQAAGLKTGMISTVNAVLGDELVDTGLHVTTPTAPEVQGYLARMVNAGLTHCILESTSHGLAQNRVAAVDFDGAVVTNIQHEHLDFHRTFEDYRDAKATLWRSLMVSERKPGTPKFSVLNHDDANSYDYLRSIPADKQVSYAIGNSHSADIWASNVTYGPRGTSYTLETNSGSVALQSPLIGEFNVSNMLAAASAAFALGISLSAIKKGIEAVDAVTGRLERIDQGQDFLAVVDFAHTPNALKRVLEAARLMIMPPGRVIVTFGCAGLRDPAKRVMMGQWAARLADLTIITAEDPRTEPLEAIMAVTARTMSESGKIEGIDFWRVADRGQAIFQACQMARAGDIVLSCGKGHEQSMCFGTIEYPWDDRDAMRSALKGKPLTTLPTAAQT